MKTLIISIYDGGWGGYSAKIITDNEPPKKVKITMEDVDIIDCGGWFETESSFSCEYIKERFGEDIKRIIVCNNGSIEIKELENE